MSIHKKGNLWYASVYQGVKNGKEIREWSKGFESKKDAQLIELEMKKDVLESNHKIYDKESFSLLADRWLKMRKGTVANSTYTGNLSSYNVYIKNYFNGWLVTEIESTDVLDFMLEIGKSPATINKVMNILKQIFDFAITLKQIKINPCVGIRKPAIRRSKKTTWNEKEINRFLNLKDTKESTAYTAFLILFSTGMRPGEVCGLRWCDWIEDYFIPTIGVDRDGEFTELKNEKAHDHVYLDLRITMQLKKLKTIHESVYISQDPFNRKSLPEDNFINCFTDDFRPMKPDYLSKAFKRIIRRNNLPEIRLYDARHSLGTNMMRNKVNPKEVAEILRHSSVKTTLDNYSHVDKEMYKNTSRAYNNKIFNRAK